MATEKKSKATRLLEQLDLAGQTGMSFSEIQRYVFAMLHSRQMTREDRGFWCTNLLGCDMRHRGLLHTFCEKRNGRWVKVKAHFAHPWSQVRRWR